MGCWSRSGLVLSLLALASPLMAQPATRRPQGIYAVVYIEENIKKEQAANPSITPVELKAYFVNLYQDLLGNPAVSGLALWVNWEALNTNPPAAANPYDWTYLDDAFNQAFRAERPKSNESAEDDPARSPAGLSDAPMAIGSDSQL